MSILAGALATAFIAKCLTALDGPGDVFLRLRDRAQVRGPVWAAKLLECPWCVGFWVGALVSALVLHLLPLWPLLAWPLLACAYAAAAGLLLEERVLSVEVDLIETTGLARAETAHLGDPCVYCGQRHDDVAPGPCPARVNGGKRGAVE